MEEVRINMTGKNMTLTPAIKQYLDEKVGRVSRYFDRILGIKAVIEKDRLSHEPVYKVEITLDANGKLIRAEEEDPDLYGAIDKVADKLEANIKRFKERFYTERRSPKEKGEVAEFAGEAVEQHAEISRRKRFVITPMTEEEAVLQMESLGHMFFVFLDAETGMTKVLYRRKKGDYGVIEVVTE